MAYILDATAMLEIARGNKNFEKFLSEELHTSLPSLHEFHANLLKETDKQTAESAFLKLRPLALNFDDSLLLKASHLMHSSEVKLSTNDSISLALAMEKDVKLLTANPNFKTLSGATFII